MQLPATPHSPHHGTSPRACRCEDQPGQTDQLVENTSLRVDVVVGVYARKGGAFAPRMAAKCRGGTGFADIIVRVRMSCMWHKPDALLAHCQCLHATKRARVQGEDASQEICFKSQANTCHTDANRICQGYMISLYLSYLHIAIENSSYIFDCNISTRFCSYRISHRATRSHAQKIAVQSLFSQAPMLEKSGKPKNAFPRFSNLEQIRNQ
jgi:hypothetical protein